MRADSFCQIRVSSCEIPYNQAQMSPFVSGKLSSGPLFSYTFPDRSSYLTSFWVARVPGRLFDSPPRRFRFPLAGRFVLHFPNWSGHSPYFHGVSARRSRPLKAYAIRLHQSPGILSREFLAFFLPAGKNLSRSVLAFLPVGKPGLPAPDFRLMDATRPASPCSP